MKFDQKEHLRKIARKGGLARIKLRGNPGTALGRQLGGLKSTETHRNLRFSPFTPRKLIVPRFSPSLAEFVGILLGDGGVTSRQVTITLHKQDDREYAQYVSALVAKLFSLSAPVKNRANTNVSVVLISRTKLVDFLGKMSIFPGNKVKHQVDIPRWIKRRKTFCTSCIRGLFDTDGCFYIDTHIIRGKVYRNPGITFTNRSLPLLSFFKSFLTQNGYAATQSSKYSITLRKEVDIVRYFGEIGSSNPKHINKFRAYLKQKGRVPKWS